MPNHRKQDRELDALYAQLPEMRCQGLCHDSCGPIGMSVRERARIVERARQPVTCGAYASCSMLTPERKCGVYDIRPMICRLWGLVKSMRCPYGCVPEGGWLPDEEAVRLLLEADRIGGTESKEQLVREGLKVLEAMHKGELARRAKFIFGTMSPSVSGRDGALAPTVLHDGREVPLRGGGVVRANKREGR